LDLNHGGSTEYLVGDLHFEHGGFHGLELFGGLIELTPGDGNFEVADFSLAFLDRPEVMALAWRAAHFFLFYGIINIFG
jgi:hypothetical protein